jgi:hypothetical protein
MRGIEFHEKKKNFIFIVEVFNPSSHTLNMESDSDSSSDEENVELSTKIGERGLLASRDIPFDGLILHIQPDKLIFGTKDDVCDIDRCAFFIFLEYMKGKESLHFDFISMLPERFDKTLAAEIDFLPSEMQVELTKLHNLINESRSQFVKRYPEVIPIDVDLYRWCYMNVNTRFDQYN